jgi:ribosomal protein L11 methyltransferase
LAIVAVKLGARAVYAIDNDPLALAVARDNFAANGVAQKVVLSGATLSGIRKKFSVVVANVTAETIVELAAALEKKVSPKGFLILSGILQQKVDAVVRRFQPRFLLVRQKRSREWATLLLQRK